MKYWLLFFSVFIAAAALGTTSPRGTDIAKLAPVEVVWLSERDGQVSLKTDMGDFGVGEDMQAALEDMKASASGTVFLDTADYLIVEQGREELLEQAYTFLRPSCMICVAEKMPDLEVAAEYLSAHEPELTLREYRVDKGEIPELVEQEGRFAWNVQ